MIQEGMYADIVVFEPVRIQNLDTFTGPHRSPVGVVRLLVNGGPVIRRGAMSGYT